jgi:hypothetical protein
VSAAPSLASSSLPQWFPLLVPVLFVGLAGVFAMAAWSSLRERKSANAWGITASVAIILACLFPLAVEWRYNHTFSWLSFFHGVGIVGLIGVGGLVVYSPRLQPSTADTNSAAHRPIPGDGTSWIVNKSVALAGIVGSYGVYWWWTRWCSEGGISGGYTGVVGTFVWLTLIGLVIATVHELGHTLTGLALGMKLRAFAIGPLQWRLRGGKWQFRFIPAGILAIGGVTGVVPASADVRSRDYVYVTLAGPLINLVTGMAALWIGLSVETGSGWQMGGLTALFGAFSLTAFAGNVIPFRAGSSYSDGAQIYQLVAGGPWAEYHKTMSLVASSAVTPLRPRDFDLRRIERAARGLERGSQGLLLRLVVYQSYLDRGAMGEAGRVLREAEAIYSGCAGEVQTGLLTIFVFGNALVLQDADAARMWWERMAVRKPAERNVDYWRAKGALDWIEGNLDEAHDALQKSEAMARALPSAGTYEFDRYCCGLLRTALHQALADDRRVARTG